MMKYGEAGEKKNLGISLISSWLEKAMEQEHRTEYRAPSSIIIGLYFQFCVIDFFPKERKRRMLGMVVLFCLLITGCEKGGRIFGGPFEDTHLFLNTELDSKLKDNIRHYGCFNFPPKNTFDESAIERYKASRMRVFHELFPQGTAAKTVFNTLKASGAQCRTENKGETSLTHCALMKEFIDGIKELYVYGWQIGRVYLTKSSFEYLLTTQDDRILDVSVSIIGCEFYELDKDLYEKSKTIKPIRRLR